jgi:hypothetical protein
MSNYFRLGRPAPRGELRAPMLVELVERREWRGEFPRATPSV